MMVEEILGNSSQAEYQDCLIDFVDIEWYECQKTIMRRMSRGGRDIALHLPAAMQQKGLDEGDVLWRGDNLLVAVHILPAEAIVLHPSVNQLVSMSYEIGNRHAPFFYANDALRDFAVPYDKPLINVFQRLGISYEVGSLALLTRRRISGSVTAGHHHG